MHTKIQKCTVIMHPIGFVPRYSTCISLFHVSSSLQTKSRFNEKYRELIRKKNSTIFKDNKFAPYGYDAVVMLARALNATEESLRRMNQSLSEFTYARSDIAEVIKDNISNTDNIKGLTVSRIHYLK